MNYFADIVLCQTFAELRAMHYSLLHVTSSRTFHSKCCSWVGLLEFFLQFIVYAASKFRRECHWLEDQRFVRVSRLANWLGSHICDSLSVSRGLRETSGFV